MFGSGRAASYGCAVVFALSLAAQSARAQAPDDAQLGAARQLGQEGVSLYLNGDYATASDKLERAYAVVKVPTLGLWSGRAFEKLGKLVEALQRYREVTLFQLKPSDPVVFQSSQTDARTAYDALLPRIPQLIVELENASASEVTLTLDGRAVPSALIGAAVPVNPGSHRLDARRAGEVASGSLTLQEGDKRRLTLAFEPVAPTQAATTAVAPVPALAASDSGDEAVEATTTPDDETKSDDLARDEGGSAGPWIMIVAGGAAAVAGGVLLGLALSSKSKVESIEEPADWRDYDDDYDRVPVYSATGFALLGVGAAALAAGIIWQVSLGADDSESGLSLRAGPTSLAIAGRL